MSLITLIILFHLTILNYFFKNIYKFFNRINIIRVSDTDLKSVKQRKKLIYLGHMSDFSNICPIFPTCTMSYKCQILTHIIHCDTPTLRSIDAYRILVKIKVSLNITKPIKSSLKKTIKSDMSIGPMDNVVNLVDLR